MSVGSGLNAGGAGGWRRGAPRRKLPLGRGARLIVNERTHIVGLGDLSATGAYLITRTPARVGEVYDVLITAPGLFDIRLRARVVRAVTAGDEGTGRPQGLAVEFLETDADTRIRLEAFVAAGKVTPN
ncbi:MAG TPA: PilZ domain-containing protein [Vicinamibacteria bacterium]|nr:PilZ domain-containing protein [Vicinamibacteria bacterium]